MPKLNGKQTCQGFKKKTFARQNIPENKINVSDFQKKSQKAPFRW